MNPTKSAGKFILLTLSIFLIGLIGPDIAVEFSHTGSEALSFRLGLFSTLTYVLILIFFLTLPAACFKQKNKFIHATYWVLITVEALVSLFRIYMFMV